MLKIKFDPDNYQAAYDAASLSELSEKEKKALETCVRGYNPNVWRGKTIGEMLEQREKDRKVEESEKKMPATPPVQSSNNSSFFGGVKKVTTTEFFNGFYFNGNITNKNQYMGKTVELSAQVLEKFVTNDGVPLIVIYRNNSKRDMLYV